MSRSMLERWFAHQRWADRLVLDALRQSANASPRAHQVYAHVLGAEHVWLTRLRGQPARIAVWPELTLEDCAALAEENAAGYEAELAALGDARLATEVPYTNSAGQSFRSRVDDILGHVALHGSYHRGQIAMLLRQAGAEPAFTDYIGYVRGVPAARTPVR